MFFLLILQFAQQNWHLLCKTPEKWLFIALKSGQTKGFLCKDTLHTCSQTPSPRSLHFFKKQNVSPCRHLLHTMFCEGVLNNSSSVLKGLEPASFELHFCLLLARLKGYFYLWRLQADTIWPLPKDRERGKEKIKAEWGRLWNCI